LVKESEKRFTKGLILFPCVVASLFLAMSFVLPAQSSAASKADPTEPARTIGPNLIYNGNFDNGVWYLRYRGYSPARWYQWFTCGGHAPKAIGLPKR